MTDRIVSQPTILVDLKKYRIRIYKYTIRSLGNPEYILLLVDPQAKSVSIERSNCHDKRAYHLAQAQLDNHRSPELFSRQLVRNLFNICGHWHKDQSYRIVGEVVQDEGIARFNVANSVLFVYDRGDQHGV